MRQSTLFTKTRKEAPKDEVVRNAILLIRAGYIYKEMAGVYTYLPLGLRVLRNIERIIREEMNVAGAQELLLTSLQSPSVWEKTDRWSDAVIDNWFKTTLADGTEIGIASTHEEPLTNLLTHYAHSHRDFPLYIYQIQTKFRNELRAKSGIMRGREFVMKDLYSFCRTEDEHAAFYARMKEAYTNVFRRSGIGEQTYFTYASGGSFSHASDEFQTVTDAGEDTIYVDPDTRFSVNEEMLGDEKILEKFHVTKDRLIPKKSVEVGNIFPLGTKFSEAFGLTYRDEAGEEKPVIMGSYGIGLGRLMGTITEVCSDDQGLVWPKEIAPFRAHLVRLGDQLDVAKCADQLYSELTQGGIEVLYDDRASVSAGEKLADADLLGMPTRIVVSEKTLRAGVGEFRDRKSGEVLMVPYAEIAKRLAA
ncbi:MAG: prolyl-tRNA synthetase [Parcubacteria group bacterium Gr01-1014_48]|nr:MAG: prolyl-tRNA synthetase [Parcubacteria group bacterium Greene0416_14]TSC73604.1 MAG: prolyl-tRNA synthetase [Parcubacteria group bacterium Gr01-1014_48]TSD00978.1 MAG: prolyl-tRNA synthetase [Parcubacteria group bacterium Greene1014_15]TSD07532.1 MAG: prolyl-tRNA synthetase [Parcubacteria group bacterium Greene0714_4]